MTPMVQVVAEALSSHCGLAAVYLFGSSARGTAGVSSDVDVGVLFDRQPIAALSGEVALVRRALERAVSREVDLVVLNDAPPDLVHRVLRDGILVLESDSSARVAFEVRARNEYFDLLPHLERYRGRVA